MVFRWFKRRFDRSIKNTRNSKATRPELTVIPLESRVVPAAVVTTSKPDYAPGELATFYTQNFQPGEAVQFHVNHTDTIYQNQYPDWLVVDGDMTPAFMDGAGIHHQPDLDGLVNGNIETTWQVGSIPGSALYLSATGQSSGLFAETTFTDSTFTNFQLTTGQSPNPVVAGSSATYVFTATRTGSGSLNIALSISSLQQLPAGASASFSVNPINFTGSAITTKTSTLTVSTTSGLAAGTYMFRVDAAGDDGVNLFVANIPLVVAAPHAAITTPPRTAQVGVSTGTITVQLQNASNVPVNAGAGGVVVNLTSSSTGGTFRNTADTAPITSVTIPAGSNSASFLYRDSLAGSPIITATPAAGSGFAATTQTETITKATPVFSSLSAPTIVYGTANTIVSGTILGNGLPPGGNVNITIGTTTLAAPINAAGAFSTSFVTGALGVGSSPYTITYAYAGDANFNSASDSSKTLTVTPKALTVTANDIAKTYGDELVFTGTEFTPSGLINGDTVTSATLTSAGADAAAQFSVTPYIIEISDAQGSGLENYTIAYVEGELTVNQRALTITADNTSKVYGETVTFDGDEFTAVGLVDGDSVATVTLDSTGAVETAGVGGSPYAIVASNAAGTGLENYAIIYVDGDLEVTQKILTITADNASKTYGDLVTFVGDEFTSDGLINGDTINSVDLESVGAAVSAGVTGSPYAIVASFADGLGLDNYAITYVDGELEVTQKALTITANSFGKIYGELYVFTGSELTAPGLINGDTVDFAVLTSDGAAASASVGDSPYDIFVSDAEGTGLENYDISYAEGELSVTRRALTVTADSTSKTYGDLVTFDGDEFSTEGLVNDDSVATVSLFSDGAVATAGVSGSPYDIVASNADGSGLDNYDISYVDGDLTVNQKALTITADDASKTYGDLVTFVGDEFTSDGLINGDFITTVMLDSAGAAETAGVTGSPYAIIASGAQGTGVENYFITYEDGELEVNQKALTITANSFGKIYGELYDFTGAEFTAPGLINGDSVDFAIFSSDGAEASATVGNSPYDIFVSDAQGTGLENYAISYAEGELSVTRKALTITANSFDKIYGEIYPFDGSEFSTGGLVNDDSVATVELESAGAAGTAVVSGSPYAIVASAAVGSGLDNYDITYADGELNVTQRTLTITADSTSKTYGETVTFDGDEFLADGLVNTDSVATVTLDSAGAAAAAGVSGSPYAIVASAAVGSGLENYDIVYVDGDLTVNQKLLTITAGSASKTYGDVVDFDGDEFTADGLINGDEVDTVTLTSDGAGAGATVGDSPYAIVASGAVGSGVENYAITYVDGALTVLQKALTITANSFSKTYGDNYTFDGTEFTDDGLINGDSIASVDLESAGTAASALVSGSPYTIVISNALGSGLENYVISYADGELTVDPRELTITADDQNKTYGDAKNLGHKKFEADGLVNGDEVDEVTLSSVGAVATAPVSGSPYDIVASNAVGTGLGNYTITYVDGNLNVNAKTLTITANSTSKTYGETVSFIGTEFTSNGLVNSDSVTTVTLQSEGAAAGAAVSGSPYAIVASAAVGSGLDNYNIFYVDGNLTVDPKALTITADDASKTYGDTVTFDGTTEFSSDGLINGDAIASVTLNSAGAAPTAGVGGSPYAIVASAAVGTGLGNYAITYADGELTVNRKALTITADSFSKTYGTAHVFDGTEFTEIGLINDDEISSVAFASSGAPATASVAGSPYTITASDADGIGLGNYDITYQGGELTVTKKAASVTADSFSKTYGDTVTFSDEYTTSGFVNGDSVASVTLTSAGADGTASVAGSSYAIVPTNPLGTGLDNYTISLNNGSLTVDPKALTITADSTSKTYGDTVTFDGDEFDASGLVNGDSVTSVTLTSDGADATADVSGSPYSIVPSNPVGSGLGNYTPSFVNGTLTVGRKVVTVSGITANNKAFDGNTSATLNTAGAQVDGLVNGDAVTAGTSAAVGTFDDASIGNGKTVFITGVTLAGAKAGNYNLTTQPTTTANITAPTGPVVINGTGDDDTLVLSGSSGNITYTLNDDTPVTLSGVTSFTFNGLGGNDTMTVLLPSSGALFTGTATFDGGPGVNTLAVDANDRPVRTVPGVINVGSIYGTATQNTNYVSVAKTEIDNASAVDSFYGPNTADRSVLSGLSADQRYVQVLYLNVLGRAGSLAEINSWLPTLAGPAGQFNVANAIEGSLEGRTRLVNTWYETYLNREAGAGAQGWVNLLMAGVSEERVLSQILGSNEFFNNAQTLSPGGTPQQNYIQTLYQTLLKRTASEAEVDGWLNLLNTQGAAAVSLAFLESAEYRFYQVGGYYVTLLHRPSDAGGISDWVNSPLGFYSIRVFFDSSNEFFVNG